MSPSGRRDLVAKAHAGAFDIVQTEPIPHQRTLRPEDPPSDLATLVRFLEEIEELVGPIPCRERPPTGERFLL